MLSLLQALAFRDTARAEELFPALWAAFQEVEMLYNYDQPRLECQRLIVDPGGPKAILQDLDIPSETSSSAATSFWNAARGRFHRTIDQEKLVPMVRAMLPAKLRDSNLLIVTDQEINPPPDWRYIIWDYIADNAFVVSMAPCDPAYWRDQTRDRIAVIKHRVRTACLSIAGSLLGLSNCQNPNCFLFDNVDATDVLDDMLAFGEEHDIPSLSGLGFSPRPRDPAVVQSLDRAQIITEAFSSNDEIASEWNPYE